MPSSLKPFSAKGLCLKGGDIFIPHLVEGSPILTEIFRAQRGI